MIEGQVSFTKLLCQLMVCGVHFDLQRVLFNANQSSSSS
ncbi:hypothetical protein R078138_00205 [Convivina praedatoris]|uniref:Uncharacterized protein n=1 Tax=Convivina praedatoris TaxID=2880963 RepID=A0ABN8H7G7_9LACO|nr:hypothetical protein LMG032447_00127 [Convivina sp. LMG 32447]CAH1850419.1 hypothetical protein R077815_00125 [Convivina sp. LMG 32447]CAH1850796.1 hypothetical protein R078138_00205 [Convivina sp. LMG 32447]